MQGAASAGKASGGKGKRKVTAAAAAADDEDADVVELEPAGPDPFALLEEAEEGAAITPSPGAQPAPDRIVSGNAYMLMYKRRAWRCGDDDRQPLQLPPE